MKQPSKIEPAERQLRALYAKNLLYTKKDLYFLMDHPPAYINHWVARLRNPYLCGKLGIVGNKTVICTDRKRRYGNETAYKYYKTPPSSKKTR